MAKHDDKAVYFLLVYDFEQAQLVEREEFIDSDQAVARYDATEKAYRGTRNRYEIVLIAADSIDTVMATHGHYFEQSTESVFSEFLEPA
ncbi:hypothetical protein [Gordonia sp. MP11Mi]|uniref:Uncharacterized protein n=1 Tax=Gordonia sp. MP11Mi TaxID=3022769 RepID=A0AA97GTY6_9ACTN